jgi:hypothetical protein
MAWIHGGKDAAISRPVHLAAPTIFSLIDNPEESIEFLESVRATLRMDNVQARLDDVEHVTPDALLALVTYGDMLVNGRGRLYGNLPTSAVPRAVVDNCGFEHLVRGLRTGKNGFVRTERAQATQGYKVDEPGTEKLVRQACEQARVPYHRISYATLVECMTNTNNHAGKEEGAICWRLMAACDEVKGRVQFVFLDPGYGICRTIKFILKTISNLPFASDADVLKVLLDPGVGWLAQILAGRPAKTRTDLPGRGRGLRRIAQGVTRGKLARLVIIANGGYIDVTSGNTKSLPGEGFRGTLVYWEFGREEGHDVSSTDAA